MNEVTLDLCDSDGNKLSIGDRVRLDVTNNQELHGTWSVYEIVNRGGIPALWYVRSEKGELLPYGYMGCFLSDKYDPKNLLMARDISKLRPRDKMHLVQTIEG